MKTLTTVELVTKLIGHVTPLGVSHVDTERLQNLKELCELTNELVRIIDNVVISSEGHQEHSIRVASEYAETFLSNTLGIGQPHSHKQSK